MVLRFTPYFETLFAVPLIIVGSLLLLFTITWIGLRFLDYIERNDHD
jgi:hypothetical protein